MFKHLTILSAIALLAYGCQGEEEKKQAPQQEKETAEVVEVQYDTTDRIESKEQKSEKGDIKEKVAYCVVSARSDSDVVGAVTFSEVEGGVRIQADIGGLSPGKHGFHIHEHGDCSATDASTAGGHFNPGNKKHGGPESAERHAGDLGNLEANDFGFAHYDRVDTIITLHGEHSIIGKSVVVHEGEDDLKTDPTGNSGKRIGCGEILESIQ